MSGVLLPPQRAFSFKKCLKDVEIVMSQQDPGAHPQLLLCTSSAAQRLSGEMLLSNSEESLFGEGEGGRAVMYVCYSFHDFFCILSFLFLATRGVTLFLMGILIFLYSINNH